MPFDADLAERVRASMTTRPAFEERRMFGGNSFMVNGNVACGVLNDDLLVCFDDLLVRCLDGSAARTPPRDGRSLLEGLVARRSRGSHRGERPRALDRPRRRLRLEPPAEVAIEGYTAPRR